MKENADKARALDAAELAKQLNESAEQSFRLRFQLAMGQTDGLKKIRQLRKERARMLTVLRERELGKSEAPAESVKKTAAKKTAVKKAPVAKKAAATKPAAPKAAAKKPAAAKKLSKG
jgi:large subunit ribosomal protein L29